MAGKNTICLWYEGSALEAARFYAETFPDSAVGTVHRAPGDYPDGKQGDVLLVEFTVIGIPCVGLNGGPQFKHNEAFSFQVRTDDQAETDRLWNAIRSRSRSGQARVRSDDDHEKDRHRRNRGGSAGKAISAA
jgi:2-polyprenyl-6-hydroxyphenyl methylase/3-demethylubiquinone-9 3-methyltransferase